MNGIPSPGCARRGACAIRDATTSRRDRRAAAPHGRHDGVSPVERFAMGRRIPTLHAPASRERLLCRISFRLPPRVAVSAFRSAAIEALPPRRRTSSRLTRPMPEEREAAPWRSDHPLVRGRCRSVAGLVRPHIRCVPSACAARVVLSVVDEPALRPKRLPSIPVAPLRTSAAAVSFFVQHVHCGVHRSEAPAMAGGSSLHHLYRRLNRFV